MKMITMSLYFVFVTQSNNYNHKTVPIVALKTLTSDTKMEKE